MRRGELTSSAGVMDSGRKPWIASSLTLLAMTKAQASSAHSREGGNPATQSLRFAKPGSPPARGRAEQRGALPQHTERVQVGFQDRLLLLALVDVLLAQPHHRAQRLHVEAVALGLGIDIANIVGDRLLFLFDPLDALDNGFELGVGETAGGWLVLGGGSGGGGRSGSSGHRLLPRGESMRRKRRRPRSPALRSTLIVRGSFGNYARRGQGAYALIHSTAQRSVGWGEPSMLLACFFEGGFLRRRRFLLVLRTPFVVRHAVDDLAALVLAHRHAFFVGGVLHPVGEAIAAEAGEIHQVDILHVGACPQVLDQAAIDGGFEFQLGLLVGCHIRPSSEDCRNTRHKSGAPLCDKIALQVL